MQPPDGEAFHLAGEFFGVDPPTRLSFSFRWEEPDPDDRETFVELALGACGEATTVSRLQTSFATEERLKLHRIGWAESFERLEEELARSAALLPNSVPQLTSRNSPSSVPLLSAGRGSLRPSSWPAKPI